MFELVSHCGFLVSLIISDVEPFFMCPLPSICFLWINVYSDPLFMSLIKLFFIFANNISDKGLISKMHKEFIQLNIKNNLIKDMNRGSE